MAYNTISYKGYGEDIISSNVNLNIRLLIGDFSILWNLFENNLFSTRLFENNEKTPDEKIKKISKLFFEKINSMDDEDYKKDIDSLIHKNYSNLLNYIKTHNKDYLYPLRNESIYNYFNMNYKENIIKRNDFYELYEKCEGDKDYNSMLIFLLIIVYRVRNNMFHGQKEITKLNLTEELFNICNNILILVLEPLEDSIVKYIK